MIYLGNAFSISMLRYPRIGTPHAIRIERISAREAGDCLRDHRFVSAYGHRDTACHLAKYLHLFVPVRRQAIELTAEDVLIVAKANVRREDYLLNRRLGPKWSFFRVTVIDETETEADDDQGAC